MNSPLPALLIQRCVDGELPESEERELLAQLDDSPNGWRQLALALIEERVFRTAARASVGRANGSRPAPAPLASPSPQPDPQPVGSSWARLAVMSVCLLAALAGGVGIGRWGTDPSSVQTPTLLVTQGGQGTPSTSAGVDLTVTGTEPAADPASGSIGGAAAEHNGRAETSLQPMTPESALPEPAMTVQFVSEQDGREQTFEIPVYDVNPKSGPPVVWSPSVPEDVRQNLQRSGFTIDEIQEWMSIPLADGRRIAVPVSSSRLRWAAL